MTRLPATASVLVLLATSVALLGGGPAIASADVPPASPPAGPASDSVRVTGTGEASGKPDTAIADLAVEVTAPTVAEALTGATTAAARMRDALVRAGTARADLRTSQAGVGPRRGDAGDITGYTATQGLTATIRDLPRTGTLISAAIAAGGDAARLNGLSFAIEDDAALLAEARTKAFADARATAALYARAAGRSLGRVRQVSEQTSGWELKGGAGMAAADAPLPVEPGRQQVAVSVTVEWALDPPAPAAQAATPASKRHP